MFKYALYFLQAVLTEFVVICVASLAFIVFQQSMDKVDILHIKEYILLGIYNYNIIYLFYSIMSEYNTQLSKTFWLLSASEYNEWLLFVMICLSVIQVVIITINATVSFPYPQPQLTQLLTSIKLGRIKSAGFTGVSCLRHCRKHFNCKVSIMIILDDVFSQIEKNV